MSAIWRGRAAGPFYALAFAALAVACLHWTREYAVPIALGVLVWFLLNALSDALRRIPAVGPVLPRLLARALSVAFLFAAIVIAARIVAANVAELTRDLSAAHDNALLAELRALAARVGLEEELSRDALIARFDLESMAAWVLAGARSLAEDASLVFLYALFLMVDERFYDAKLRALQPDEARRTELRGTLRNISRQTRLYLWLMTLISLGVAICTWAVCSAFGVAGAGFWGFLAFGLNFIPTIGSIAAVLIPAAYAALTLDDPAALAAMIAVLAAVQFTAGEVVVPKLMGEGLNLSSIVILLALVAWGAVWGPAGMFLAIPLTVILTMVLSRFPSTRPVAVFLSKDGRAGPGPWPAAEGGAAAPDPDPDPDPSPAPDREPGPDPETRAQQAQQQQAGPRGR